eukprot:m51a1_g14079 hypothetical protein (184) ;mRNA; r:1304079-1304673
MTALPRVSSSHVRVILEDDTVVHVVFPEGETVSDHLATAMALVQPLPSELDPMLVVLWDESRVDRFCALCAAAAGTPGFISLATPFDFRRSLLEYVTTIAPQAQVGVIVDDFIITHLAVGNHAIVTARMGTLQFGPFFSDVVAAAAAAVPPAVPLARIYSVTAERGMEIATRIVFDDQVTMFR